MRHEFNLQPITRNSKPLVFGWDSSTGELWGPDSIVVLKLAEQSMMDGSVDISPFPTSFEIKRPLHSPTELAAILGMRWKLPPELMSYYPVNKEHGGMDTDLY